jgi:hypothetical protein
MSNTNIKPSDVAAVVGSIDPDANTAAAYTTAWVDMENFEAVMAIIMVGAMVATSTVDAKIQQATDVSGTGAKDITGKAITQLTAAGSDDDKQAIINLRADEMDAAGGFTHVQLSMTVGTADSDSAAVLLGFYPHYGVASANDEASVDEIIA